MRRVPTRNRFKSVNTRHAPTFPSWAPCRELDFICHDPPSLPIRFKIPRVRLSDHLPLMFDFEPPDIPRQPPQDGAMRCARS